MFKKICGYCKHSFESSSRNTKFCCNECRLKYNKRRDKRRSEYVETKASSRLYARSHALAVSTLDLLSEAGLLEKVCSFPGCTETVLEVHHKDLNWLNNSPSNLQYFCKSHHAFTHSALSKEFSRQDLSNDFNVSIYNFLYLKVAK